HTKVDRVSADVQFDTSVLRQSAFGDVEVRHDLDAGNDGVGEVAWRRDHLVQHAVRTNANLELVFEGLEVDVARLILDGEEEHHVQQFADRLGLDGIAAEINRTDQSDAESACFGGVFVDFFQLADDVFDA